MILVLNQKNMKELPFFAQVIRELISSGRPIPKIIGHPASLLLTLLIDPDHQYDQKVSKFILLTQQKSNH